MAKDTAQVQRICPQCKQGTTFLVYEMGSEERFKSHPDYAALLLALICRLCDGVVFYQFEAMSTALKFKVVPKGKKGKTTKRIA